MRYAGRFLLVTPLIALFVVGTVFLIRAAQDRKPHVVDLTWHPSIASNGVPIAGYNVYRSTISGGSYVRIASAIPTAL